MANEEQKRIWNEVNAPRFFGIQLGPAAAAFREAGDAAEPVRPTIEVELRAALGPFSGPRGVELPGMALLATASRDASG